MNTDYSSPTLCGSIRVHPGSSVVKIFLFCLLVMTSRAADNFRFAEATIDDLQSQMAAGKLTARELTSAYLERIAQIDKAGPRLNAIIELNPDALAMAEKAD